MKLSKRAEKLRDELADADSYNQWADKQPDKNNYMHTYIRGFNAGYSAARLEANVLEEALELQVSRYRSRGYPTGSEYTELINSCKDALKKYRGEQ